MNKEKNARYYEQSQNQDFNLKLTFFLYMLISDLLPQIIPKYVTFSGSISLNI